MNRVQQLQAVLAERSLPAVLIDDPINVGYLTGFTGSTAALLVTPYVVRFITDGRYDAQSRQECPDFERVLVPPDSTYSALIARTVRELGLARLVVEAETTTCVKFSGLGDLLRATDELPGVELGFETDLVMPLRRIKDAGEIAVFRTACGLADRAFDYALTLLHPGVSERDIALDIEYWMRKHGADREAFDTIVASGPRSALPHGRPTARLLERGDFVTLDFGARVAGYHSDLTRTVVLGPATDRQREVYHVVLDAQRAGLAAIRSGVDGKAVDTLVRDQIAAAGLGEYFPHSLGHGLGRTIHESPPLLSQRMECPLAAGNVVTVEPGVYIEGWGGVRIEDDVVVTDAGCEVLTHAPKELLELPV